MTQVSTFTIGTTGNPVLDAMFVTRESFFLPFEDRAFFAGDTIAKWGGDIGTGATLTYSFFNPSSSFPADYPSARIEAIGTVPDEVKAQTRDAFAVWSQYVNVRFSEVQEAGLDAGDARVGVSLSNPVFLPPNNSSAEAAPPSFPTNSILGDIFLSERYVENPALFTPGTSHHFTTMLHEIGHAVFNLQDITPNAGLGGAILAPELNYRTQTIMSFSVVPGATVGDGDVNQGDLSYWPTTPMVLDVLAAQWLYGANQSHAAGDDTYTFSQQQTYHETIWDAGGNDTISVAGNSKAATINLTPGSYSDVGSVITASTRQGQTTITDTVGIAFGAVIENAIGGSGDDVLIGNAFNNQLTGGAGNDTINGDVDANGVGGHDTAVYQATSSSVQISLVSDGVFAVDASSSGEGVDRLTSIERLLFSDGLFALAPDGTIRPLSDTAVTLQDLGAANVDTAFALGAAHQLLLGGVPNQAGFIALINAAVSTNFGAGPGPVFNTENIYINLTNNLVQGNADARARFDGIATGNSLPEKIAAIYQFLIPAANQTTEGLAFITRLEGIAFYQSVAAERGIAGDDGAAIIAMASLLRIVVAQDIGIGDAVNDLAQAVTTGTSNLPSSGSVFTDIEIADGAFFDGDDTAAIARLAQPTEPDAFAYWPEAPDEHWSEPIDGVPLIGAELPVSA